ncbi:MAG: 6-bladed beta-propeller, partial [Bacteroidia bacterium]|nr:6-bladed beta-propeller [Bacteroidia bacterium]
MQLIKTMKSNPSLTLLLCLLVMACSSPKQQPSTEIIKIDVLKAFDNQKNVRLSEFIRDVEFIPLESTKDSWFRYSENYLVGEKYVMVGDVEKARVLLFDRQGKFIRAIGTKGKGPHELLEPREATMDPAEEFVFFYDFIQGKLLKFSIEGAFINELNIRKLTPFRYISRIQFINKNEFVISNYRPYAQMDGFASLPVFDKNLKHVRDILPRANDENLVINVAPHVVLTVNPERITFWEPSLDTLYTITPEGSAIPTHVIGFSKGGPDHEFVTTNINPNLYAVNSIVSIVEAGHYFHILGMKNNDWFRALY